MWSCSSYAFIEPQFPPMTTGCILNRALRHQKGSGARHGKIGHRNNIFWPTMHGEDASNRILVEFTIASNNIQFFVIRKSKLVEPNWHWKITSTAHFRVSVKDVRKLVYLTERIRQKCSDETPNMLLRNSRNNELSPPRIWRRTT